MIATPDQFPPTPVRPDDAVQRAWQEARYILDLPDHSPCPECHGRRSIEGMCAGLHPKTIRCPRCEGRGVIADRINLNQQAAGMMHALGLLMENASHGDPK